MKTLIRLLAVVVLAAGCAQKPGGDENPGGLTDLATAPRTDMAGPEPAWWKLTANFQVNGQELQTAARSAVFVHQTSPTVQTELVLTDVVDYCSAIQNGICPATGKFRVVFDLNGDTPGDYSIAQGRASVYWGDVTPTCQGTGLGADTGSITLSRLTAQPDGIAEVHFDFTSSALGTSASGIIKATFCDND